MWTVGRARTYDAVQGRFKQLDPAGFDGGDRNLYRYVGGGPAGWTDPLGLASVSTTVETVAGQVPATPSVANIALFDDPNLKLWPTVGALNSVAIRVSAQCSCGDKDCSKWVLTEPAVEFDLFIAHSPGKALAPGEYGHEFLHLRMMALTIRDQSAAISTLVDDYITSHNEGGWYTKADCERLKHNLLGPLSEAVFPNVETAFLHSGTNALTTVQDVGLGDLLDRRGNMLPFVPTWGGKYNVVRSGAPFTTGKTVSQLGAALSADGKGPWFFPLQQVVVGKRLWPDWDVAAKHGLPAPDFKF